MEARKTRGRGYYFVLQNPGRAGTYKRLWVQAQNVEEKRKEKKKKKEKRGNLHKKQILKKILLGCDAGGRA